MSSRIRKDDTVEVIRGRDKGKRGKVQSSAPQENMVLVEGVNIVKKHQRAGAQGARQGGIVSIEKPMSASKVMPVCQSCDKPTRVGFLVLDDGTKSRVCKKCQQMMT
jgi:large subunit ribosomal protein L24